MWQWWNGVISGEIPLHVNSSEAYLIEKTLMKRLGHLSADGALVVESGKFTGRAAQDKYIVRDETTEEIIDWEGKVLSLTDETFIDLKTDFLRRIHLLKPELFIMERSAGADATYAIGVNLLTTTPIHSLFCQLIMRERNESHPLGEFTIFHDPDFECDVNKYGLRSSTVIALNFKRREILIFGTGYCGEIKKAIFTVMNTLLPDYGVLPMHSGANADPQGNVSVFFGLSGTGKTTLSTDTGMKMIGDDEHGLSERGIFNFEGGCYAKTFNLKEHLEPDIYKATNRFGSLIENVALDKETRRPIFEDKSLTENGRSTYPLKALKSIIEDGKGKMPSNFFFLSADAMGVLPLVGELNHEEAAYYFLLGYTAKVAGTEIGMKGVTATFSHCFGAPFMMRHPEDYAHLLREIIKKNAIRIWMVNTGWYGGPYGVGRRYDLSLTRSCIRSIQNGGAHQATFVKDSVFSISVPTKLEGVDGRFLKPETLWEKQDEYFANARKLKELFDENYQKILKGTKHAFFDQKNPGLH
jgi:phosphoenolpyruvate carboxykinase (ATP)